MTEPILVWGGGGPARQYTAQAAVTVVGPVKTPGQAREIVEEISREKGLHFRGAFIDSEQDKGYLQQRLKDGKIKPLAPSPNLPPVFQSP